MSSQSAAATADTPGSAAGPCSIRDRRKGAADPADQCPVIPGPADCCVLPAHILGCAWVPSSSSSSRLQDLLAACLAAWMAGWLRRAPAASLILLRSRCDRQQRCDCGFSGCLEVKASFHRDDASILLPGAHLDANNGGQQWSFLNRPSSYL